MARRLGGSSQLSLGVGLFSREGKKKKKKNCTIKNTVQLEPYLSHTLVPCKEPYPNARYRDLDSCTVYQGKQWGYATGNITGRAGDIRSLGVGRRRGAPWARNGGNGRRYSSRASSRATASASWVLPMPGSPRTSKGRPAPRAALTASISCRRNRCTRSGWPSSPVDSSVRRFPR